MKPELYDSNFPMKQYLEASPLRPTCVSCDVKLNARIMPTEIPGYLVWYLREWYYQCPKCKRTESADEARAIKAKEEGYGSWFDDEEDE